MLTIARLADCPDVIPLLTRWFQAQWPDHYAGRHHLEVEQDFYCERGRDRLPIRLVGFETGQPVATIVLRQRALDGHPAYQPGLGGLYVLHSRRSRGFGTELVRAGMSVARELGYDRLYTSTGVAAGILNQLGWEPVATTVHAGERLTFYRCAL